MEDVELFISDMGNKRNSIDTANRVAQEEMILLTIGEFIEACKNMSLKQVRSL